jgi:hypothetical protein
MAAVSTKLKLNPEQLLARIEDHEAKQREKLSSIIKRAQAF